MCDQLNHKVIFVDAEGVEWTEYRIVEFIFDLFKQGLSLHGICRILNEKKLPTPKGKEYWLRGSVHFILTNRIYCGQVWANRYGKQKTANDKRSNVILPQEEWIRLPDAPALISVEEFDAIQKQLKINKDESIRNYKGSREELGLLRCGYVFCGVCRRRMRSIPASSAAIKQGYGTASYVCVDAERDAQAQTRHTTRVSLPKVDGEVRTLIVNILKTQNWCRERVKELRREREKEEPVITKEDIQSTVDKLKAAIRRLYRLAEHAIDDETVDDLAEQMNALERQKRQAEQLLLDLDETDEQEEELEKEIQRFELWAEGVRPLLTDPTYKPSYRELRLAIRVLGIRCIVFPTGGEYPFRHKLDVMIPEIMKVLDPDIEAMSRPGHICGPKY